MVKKHEMKQGGTKNRLIYPDDFLNKIICGDNLEIMSHMPDECIPLVITDPPFNLGKNYDEYWNDNLPIKEYLEKMEYRFREIHRVMMVGAGAYIFMGQRYLLKFGGMLEKIGFNFCQFLIWYGRNGFRFRSMQMWNYSYEHIFLVCKSVKYPRLLKPPKGLGKDDILIYPRPQSNYKGELRKFHVCQKPVKLIKHIIIRSEGDIIFDPFMGSGSTGMAAKELNRQYIGIECNPRYVELARKRIVNTIPYML